MNGHFDLAVDSRNPMKKTLLFKIFISNTMFEATAIAADKGK